MFASFLINQIDNGYIVKFRKDSDADDVWNEGHESSTIYAATLADAYATIANKCDMFVDQEMDKEGQDQLPF